MAVVLVVDDERGIRITLKEFLKNEGHDVFTAGEHSEALEILQNQPIDVVVTDIVLPKSSGLQVVESAASINPAIKTIIITGEPTVDTAIKAIKMGAFDYLAKPICGDEICQIVDKAFKEKEKLDITEKLWSEVEKSKNNQEVTSEKFEFDQEDVTNYKVLADSSSDAITIIDSNGSFLYMNAFAAKRLEIDPHNYHGLTLWDIQPKKMADAQIGRVRQALAKGQGYILESLTRFLGKPRWYRTSVQPIFDSDGVCRKAIFVAVDIHEKKQIEEALEESEKMYRAVVENVGEGIAIVDDEEKFTFANPAAERMFGQSSRNLVGRSMGEFISEDQFELLKEQTILRRQGQSGNYDLAITSHTLKSRNLEITATPLFDSEGWFQGTLGIFRDVTDAKIAEQELIASEEKYRNLIELSVDGILIVQDQKIIFANNQLAEMLGSEVKDIVGSEFKKFIASEEYDNIVKLHIRHISGERDLGIIPTKLVGKDGCEVNVEINGTMIDYDGKPGQMLLVRKVD